MMQLNVTPDFKKRSLKFGPEFPAAAKLESVELVIPNPDGKIKTAGLSFIIYSARCGSRKLAVCDAFTGTGTITGTLNLCTDRMVDEFYHLPLGTRRSFHAVLWSEADQWMIGAGRISIVNNPGSDSLNPAPLPADRYPTFEEVEEMIRNSGGLDEPVVRRVNGIAPDNTGNVSITIPGDVSELKDRNGLTLTALQKNALATLSTTYAAKNHSHSEYALKSELPDVSGFITADKLNLYQLKADAFSGKYADLAGKPSAFPPASHTHVVADVNGLADELSRKLTVPAGGNAGQFLMKTVSGCGWSSIDLAAYITITQARNEFAAKNHEHSQYALASALQNYAAQVHTHVIGDVTGLQDALDGKAVADHNHDSVYAPKEATAAALNTKLTIPAGGTAGQVIGKTADGYGWITVSGGISSWNDLTDKPSTFPPAAHTHAIGDVTGLENKLSEKISSVNGQVPNSSGAVTLPVATSKADGLMSAADKAKLDGLDTTGSTGDMLKSVYDTNDDGIVDHAATADTVGATAAAQVADAVGKAHTHANKATLDKFGEANGKPTFDGAEIGGGSGTVKSVNGQLPDGSGNVTVETGGGMTARLVSGEVAASAGEWLVFTAAGSVTLPAGANLSEVKITAETAGVSVLPASGEAVAGDNGLSLDMPGYTVLLQFRETARNWVPVEITAARPSVLTSSEEKPAIPDDGLVFYVPLESAEAATGQPIGNNGVTFTPDAVLGRDVAVFDGSANLSFTPTGMPSGTAPHTKSLWIKFNGDTGQVYVLAWGSNGSDSASTITARNNKWAWCFAGDWEETDVDVPAGQWLNVTTTHSAGVNKLYVNGTLRNTHSRNLNISGNSGTIGSFLSGSEKITGAMAALRVYDRVLTADEIAALAAEFTI